MTKEIQKIHKRTKMSNSNTNKKKKQQHQNIVYDARTTPLIIGNEQNQRSAIYVSIHKQLQPRVSRYAPALTLSAYGTDEDKCGSFNSSRATWKHTNHS